MKKEQVVKCKQLITKKGYERLCDRFLLKVINNKQINVKCPSCGSYAIITVNSKGDLQIIHLKDGEEKICQK